MRVGSRVRSDGAGRGAGGPWLRIAVIVTGLVFLFPLGYLLGETMRLGGDLWGVATSEATVGPLARSLLIAGSTAVACAVLGTTLAVLVSRTDLPGRRLLRVALALPLVIPSFVGATALLAAFGPGALIPALPRLEGFWGALIVLTLLSYPYVYLTVLGRLATTNPNLEEAARQLGSGPVSTLFRVVVPQLRSSVAAGTMLVFLYALSDFGAVSLMRYDTITRAIFSARLFDRVTSLTLGLVLALLALAAAAGERYAGPRRQVVTAGGGGRFTYPLGRWRLPALALIIVVVGSALVTPIGVFATWVVRGSTTVGVGFSGLGDDLGFLIRPAVNSIFVSVVTGLVAMVLLVPLAFAAARRRTRLVDGVRAAVTSTFALPGLVVALAVVFWAIQAPGALAGLYQSFPLLVLGYVLHFGAQSMRSTEVAIASVPRLYEETAQTLGVGPRRRFVEVDLPLIAPGLITGAGLVMLSTLKELPATLLLAPGGFRTLATRIWGAAQDGFYAEVGITSLTLIAISGVLTWALVLRPELGKRPFPATSDRGTSGPR